MAFLTGLDGAAAGRRYPLQAPCLIGRDAYNHIIVKDPRVSRQHARVTPEAGGFVVYDLDSANGTFVNGAPVRRRRLTPGDMLRFGPATFRFDGDATLVEQEREELGEPLTTGRGGHNALVGDVEGERGAHGELGGAYRTLRRLYGLLHALSSVGDTGELLDRVGVELLALFPSAERAAVLLRDRAGELLPRLVRSRDGAAAPLAATVRLRGGELMRSCTAEVAALAAALSFRGDVVGALHLEGHLPFGEGERELLEGVAAQVVLALQESRQRERLREDLHLAQQIQRSLLPRRLPTVDGLQFAAEYRPAFSVGGDFYDLFRLGDERIGLFIGDVAGKGIAAALLMARLSSDLRVAALSDDDPARVLEQVNRMMLEREQPEIFVTGVYLTLEVKSREILLANAGHLPPLVRRRSGTIERVEGGATALGIVDHAGFDATRLHLGRGDALVLCTDGVPEATDGEGRQFGWARVEASLGEGPATAEEIVERLLGGVRRHAGEAAQSDDLTLVVCGVSEGLPLSRHVTTVPSPRFGDPP
jgi:sigma-B regulation protein RsbU (phosphoserine phosphatase)